MSEFRCLSTIGMLGYGIPEDSLRRGVERRPHMIGADAGSTDAGPHKLGRGVPDVSRAATALETRPCSTRMVSRASVIRVSPAVGSRPSNMRQVIWLKVIFPRSSSVRS